MRIPARLRLGRDVLPRTAAATTLIVFFIFVLLPTLYLVSYTFTRWGEVRTEVFANPLIGDEHWKQTVSVLIFSLKLALLTVAFDLTFGIPLAYFLSHKKFRGRSLLEDAITLPLVIPTSGFGFATLITWTTTSGIGGLLGLGSGVTSLNTTIPIINVPLIIFIVHVALTFPYIVRTVETKFQSISPRLEMASRTLGASTLTTFRLITFPLSTPGVFSGSILAFARSLGETGATIIVAGVSTTASIAIVRWTAEFKLAAASFLGSLIVLIAWVLIFPIELYMTRRSSGSTMPLSFLIPTVKRLLKVERLASRKLPQIKNVIPLAIVIILVIFPIAVVLNSVVLYWSMDPYTKKVESGVFYQLFGPSNYFGILSQATLTSTVVALTSTYISACIGIPLAFLVQRRWYGRLIRSILKVPLVIPTSSLGLSILLMWGRNGLGLLDTGIWLIILTHIVFSVPVIVESTIAAYEGSEIQVYEEAAHTLGASTYDTLETVSLPLIKGGIFTGVVLSFTHSLGETGATFIVMGRDITVPTLVVNMVEALAVPAALFASTYLIGISLVMLAVFRVATRGRLRAR